jgi:hypothetical protein
MNLCGTLVFLWWEGSWSGDFNTPYNYTTLPPGGRVVQGRGEEIVSLVAYSIVHRGYPDLRQWRSLQLVSRTVCSYGRQYRNNSSRPRNDLFPLQQWEVPAGISFQPRDTGLHKRSLHRFLHDFLECWLHLPPISYPFAVRNSSAFVYKDEPDSYRHSRWNPFRRHSHCTGSPIGR